MAEENQADTNIGADQSDVPDNQANATAAAGNENGKAAQGNPRPSFAESWSSGLRQDAEDGSVRVDRLVKHTKYRRYVRRTSKFMAHDELGATIGDKVRIVETRPMSARKRWRVIEIVQKAAK
jgi:small subunit ribosomal protein S17